MKQKRLLCKNRREKVQVILFCFLCLSVLSFILYFRYIIGQKYYLFPKVVMDGITQFYPFYMNLADILETKHSVVGFSLMSGLGEQVGSTNFFDIFISIWGKESVAYLIGIGMILKIVLGGTFFGVFLLESGKTGHTSLLFGIMYGFSIQIIVCGSWSTQGELAVIIAISLWLIERFVNKGGFFRFVCIGLLFLSCLSFYHRLLYGAVLIIYVILRFTLLCSKKQRRYNLFSNKKIKRIAYIIIILLGLLLSISIGRSLSSIMKSERVFKGMEGISRYSSWDVIRDNKKNLILAVLLSLNPCIAGIPGVGKYYGDYHLIADGGMYCGIVTLLLLPQWSRVNVKRRKYTYLGMLLLVLVYFYFPLLRYVSNAFTSIAFRDSRMWIIIIFMYIASEIYDGIVKKEICINVRLLLLTGVGLILLMLFMKQLEAGSWLKWKDILATSVFIIIYIIALLRLQIVYTRSNCILTGMVLMLEILWMWYPFVNNADAISDINDGYYNDGTIEMVEKISQIDQNFYRINKSYESLWYCDAQVQGYAGTQFYHGGIVNQDIIDFIHVLGIPTHTNRSGYLTGTYGNTVLSTLLSVKYVLAKGEPCIEYGYNSLGTSGDIGIYENEYALGLGCVYKKAILKESFEQIDSEKRADVLLDACVLDNIQEVNGIQWVEGDDVNLTDIEADTEISIDNYRMLSIIDIPELSEDDVVLLLVSNTYGRSIKVRWAGDEGWTEQASRLMSIYDKSPTSVLELNNLAGNKYIVIEGFDGNKDDLSNVTVKILKKDSFYEKYISSANALRSNSLQQIKIEKNAMSGYFENENEGMLVLSIPYNAPLEYYIDGKKAVPVKVNYAFTGFEISEGKHQIAIMEAISFSGLYRSIVYIIVFCGIGQVCETIVKRKEEKLYNGT